MIGLFFVQLLLAMLFLLNNFFVRLFLKWLLGSKKEYRIPRGGKVLVIEIGKNYVRYFKLKKPENPKTVQRTSQTKMITSS